MSLQVQTVTIALGASESGIIDCSSTYSLAAIEVPTAWDAANITFLGAAHPGTTMPTPPGSHPQDVLEAALTFKPVFNATAEVAITTAPTTGGAIISLDPALLKGVAFLKLRSGTNALPVNQTAARTLRVTLAE